MAVQETRNLPAQFIEDLGKDYAKQLTATTAIPVDTSKFAPTVAAQDALQTRAATLAGTGVGSFAPFIQAAQQAAADAGTTVSGIAGLTGAPTAAQTAAFTSPFQQQVIDTTLAEFDRQTAAGIPALAAQAIGAGAFGGGRQAIIDAERDRNLQQNLAAITGKGYTDAFDRAMGQFNVEQDRARGVQEDINKFGLAALARQASLGAEQRGIESEGITADRLQFEEERDFPYKQVQYMQSLLQGLPIATKSYTYQEPSSIDRIISGAGNLMRGTDAFTDYFSRFFPSLKEEGNPLTRLIS